MELTDRYIHAVTRQLPAAQRDDVARELRATIEDTLSEGDVDESAVLQQLGDPSILAQRYGAKQTYLIGPDYFPEYRTVLKVLLPAVVALFAILSVIDGWSAERDTGDVLLDVLKTSLVAAGQVVFWTTLGFAIAERTGSQALAATSWSPQDLPAAEPARQIGKFDALAGAAMALFVPIAVIVVPRRLDRLHPDGIQFFNPDLSTWWLFGLIGIFVLFALHQIWQYTVGRWTTPLMTSLIVLNGIWLTYLLALLLGQDVVNPAWLAHEVPDMTEQVKRWIIGSVLATAVIITVIEVAEAVRGNQRLDSAER